MNEYCKFRLGKFMRLIMLFLWLFLLICCEFCMYDRCYVCGNGYVGVGYGILVNYGVGWRW